jgi:hypothetical protein
MGLDVLKSYFQTALPQVAVLVNVVYAVEQMSRRCLWPMASLDPRKGRSRGRIQKTEGARGLG